jgi:hypothetical protein
MTELGAYLLKEQQARILARSSQIGRVTHWPALIANGTCYANEAQLRLVVGQGLPAVLDELERQLVDAEARAARSANLQERLADEDRQRRENEASFQRHQDDLLIQRLGRR